MKTYSFEGIIISMAQCKTSNLIALATTVLLYASDNILSNTRVQFMTYQRSYLDISFIIIWPLSCFSLMMV